MKNDDMGTLTIITVTKLTKVTRNVIVESTVNYNLAQKPTIPTKYICVDTVKTDLSKSNADRFQ